MQLEGKSMENNRSSIKLRLVDILDQPIKNLKVEVKTANKIWHAGVTDAEGFVEFTAAKGKDLIVHVEHWIYKDMKPVAKFFTGLEKTVLKLVSPKVKQTVTTKPKGEAGEYVRGTYKVKAGDSLAKIAKEYQVSPDYLAQINQIKNKNLISVGQEIKVPPVTNRTTSAQKHTPAKSSPPHSAKTPKLAPVTTRGTVPILKEEKNSEGKSMAVIKGTQPAIIFPFNVRPLNDSGQEFDYNDWTKGVATNAACFGYPRKKKDGGLRKHAGRDLYAKDFTEVFAIADGKVLAVSNFYQSTNAISIHHQVADGREFVVRYGEVDPATIAVKAGDVVSQGQIIGKTGILLDSSTKKPMIITRGKNVSMLHFEFFSGINGLDEAKNLSDPKGEFMRRDDLQDSLQILQEGYFNTFKSGVQTLRRVASTERKSVAELALSELGEEFIKNFESLRLDYYEDHLGYCTVGWGHLTGGKSSCASQGFKIGQKLTLSDVQNLFENDKKEHEKFVKEAIKVPLYQYEYDALCSLAFNIGSLSRKAPSLCKKINALKYEDAAVEFLDITNGGTKGLVIRRKLEREMFLNAKYDSEH